LEKACEEIVHAPDVTAFLSGYAAAAAQLQEGYQDYLTHADASANAPDIRMIQRIVDDLSHTLQSIAALSADSAKEDADPARTNAWGGYITGLFAAAGGVSGLSGKPEKAPVRPAASRFEWPAPIQFDDRLHHADLGTYEDKMSLPLRERAIGEFEVYFNEF